MERVLLIDDERVITKNSVFQPFVQIARNSGEALWWLAVGETDEQEEFNFYCFDVILFDHDLGGDDTTRPVVEYLCELAYNGMPYPAKMYVHTANTVGRDWIVSSLKRWEYDVQAIDAVANGIVKR